MKNLFIILLLIIFSTSLLYAQNRIVKGRVIDEDLRALPSVLIMIDDTITVGKTDFNGFFQIDIPVVVKDISFRFIGMDSAFIELVDECTEVEIVMMFSPIYDFITLRKIKRLQLRRYKKLPELHREAFKKVLFTTDTPCYKRNISFK